MTRAALAACGLALCLLTAAGNAPPPRVACTLARPIVDVNETDEAAAFTDAAHTAPLQIQWSATAGAFAGGSASGPHVTWQPEGAKPGHYTLSATVATTSGHRIGTCALQVIVTGNTRSGPGRRIAPVAAPSNGDVPPEVQRDLLVRGAVERGNYGLYSYILFGAHWNDDNKQLYTALLREYLALDDIRYDEESQTAQLNATYVPVMSFNDKPNVEWLLENYDYRRAHDILHTFKVRGSDGPFIISTLRPVPAGGDPGPFIILDLSTKPVSVVGFWMQAFRSETTQQRVWNRQNLGNVVLDLRTILAAAGQGLPDVMKAVSFVSHGSNS